MKSQVLKQSAIAFFIGSVISGVAVSADPQPTTSDNAPYAAFEKALTDKISAGLSDRFVSKDEHTKDLGTKADKSNLDNRLSSVTALLSSQSFASKANTDKIEALEKKVEDKADVTELNSLTDQVAKDLEDHEDKINVLADTVSKDKQEVVDAITELRDNQDKLIDESTALREDVENVGEALAAHDKALDEKATKAEIITLKSTLSEQLDKQKEELGKQAASLHAKAGRQEMNEALDKKADLAELNKLTDDVAEQLDEHDTRLDDHDGVIEAIKDRVMENEGNIVKLNEKADAISTDVNNVASNVEANEERLNELEKTKAYTEATKIKDSFDQINDDLDNISDAVKTNGENIEGLDSNIKVNSDKISENTEGLQALAKAQNELSDAHEALADLHDELRTEHNALDKTVKENKQDADKRLTATSKALGEISTKLGVTSDSLTANIQTVGQNSTRIASNGQHVLHNQHDISELQVKHHQLRTEFNQLNHRVENLQKEVRRGLAAQAALTGLFQPYKVGHANFTAAVGGYKSQTAVAVGTGYRFNENVAAKAGVAFSGHGGGASYNVGVNFEW